MSVPDHYNKVGITIKQVIIVLLVEGLVFNIRKATSVRHHKVKRNKTGYAWTATEAFVITAPLIFLTWGYKVGLSKFRGKGICISLMWNKSQENGGSTSKRREENREDF